MYYTIEIHRYFQGPPEYAVEVAPPDFCTEEWDTLEQATKYAISVRSRGYECHVAVEVSQPIDVTKVSDPDSIWDDYCEIVEERMNGEL